MSGMTQVGRGAKLEDSNVAGLGGKENRDLKKAAAETEPAWIGAGKKPGVQIWRIEKFKVKAWPVEQYGKFYDGDAYIVLFTYKPDPESEKLAYNVHFWLGKDCSQDEAGTAAYKTVELDDLLGDLPVQFREVDGHESPEFLEIFSKGKMPFSTMQGGIESGFNKVKPTEYKPRLLHIKGRKMNKMRIVQVPLDVKSLNHGDTFVLDAGLKIFQWNGQKAGMFEKRKGQDVIQAIRDERQGKPSKVVVDGLSKDAEFWKLLGLEGPPADVAAATPDDEVKVEKPKAYLLSDENMEDGKIKPVEMKEVTHAALKAESGNVVLVDVGTTVYAWIGKGASKAERAAGITSGVEHVKSTGRDPMIVSVVRVMEDNEPAAFKKVVGLGGGSW